MDRRHTMETRETVRELLALGPAAMEELRGEIEAVPDERVIACDLYVPGIAIAVTLAVPRIEEIVAAGRDIPAEFEIEKILRVGGYAAAAWHAYVRAMEVSDVVVDALVHEATACREALLSYVTACARHGWVRKAPLANVGKVAGPRGLALDVVDLAELLSECWWQVEALGFPRALIGRATALGVDLLVAVSQPKRPADPDAARTCARAFTLLLTTYDECRTLVRRLRYREGDHDEIAPPIGIASGPAATLPARVRDLTDRLRGVEAN
ncbi:MAG TPA: hypothetical protein VFG69_06955 [Nannocystaceae bacterium]|nr:hypothetical protein [Nannocystaceae bacterium]